MGRAGGRRRMPSAVRVRGSDAGLWSPAIACVLLGLGVLPACADAGADSPTLERTDSAGVELVVSRGADRSLEWTFEPRLTLGGTVDGPESFFDLSDRSVSSDADGNIYVLDAGNSRVLVFDAAGSLVRELGQRGGGPGELEQVGAIMVSQEGGVSVFDWSKRSFVRWAPDRSLLPSRPLGPVAYSGAGMGKTSGGDLYLTIDSVIPGESEGFRTLGRVSGGDPVPIVRQRRTNLEMRDFGCVRFTAFPPLFAPELTWTVAGDSVLYNIGPEYVIEVRVEGELRRRISRDVPLTQVTETMALAEVGESMKVSFDGRIRCEIPQRKVVDVRGYASTLPAVRDLSVSPDGGVWVRRGAVRTEPFAIDVFDATGAYLGTLPPGTPWPAAFTPAGEVIAVEKDELDVPRVVVYEVSTAAS